MKIYSSDNYASDFLKKHFVILLTNIGGEDIMGV